MINEASTSHPLQATALSFGYRGSDLHWQLESLSVGPGQTLLLTGPSGAGKTTWLRLLCGLQRPNSGSVVLGGESLCDLSPHALRAFRLTKIGLILQDFALIDYLSAGENILLPSRFQGHQVTEKAAHHARYLAEYLQIDSLWNQRVGLLSQGERQRIAVARALATRPSFVFADEPTASLDRSRRDAVASLLTDYAAEAQVPLVLITHDPELVKRFPDPLDVETLRT